MQLPYTAQPLDAVVAALTAVGVTLSAVLWQRPLQNRVSTTFLLAAIWVMALVPFEPFAFYTLLHRSLRPAHAMMVSAGLATVAMFLGGRMKLTVVALAGELALAFLGTYVEGSDCEMAVLHLTWFGLLLGLGHALDDRTFSAARAPHVSPLAAQRSFIREDLVLFGVAVTLATLVAVFVLERSIDSDDEWAYTYQADLFAHGRAYAEAPPCGDAFRMYWVWFYLGRAFAQYTPGWPLFMAPFAAASMAWFAASVTHGMLVVGVARLARRLSVSSGAPPSHTAYAGRIAAFTACMGAATLMNAGSRFPHVFVAACFAWSVEAACAITTPGISPRSKLARGLLLGFAVSFLAATRPADAAMLEVGVLLFFVYSLVRGRVGWHAFAGSAFSFGVVSIVSLVILRLQLGAWFKTGYELASQFHSWVVLSYSLPGPSELKYGVPLATSAYCFWPCAPAFGAAGLVNVRGEGRAISFMLIVGALFLLAFLSVLEFGRGVDFGYGPRYSLPHVVGMAVGAGVLFAPLFARALETDPHGPVTASNARVLLANAGPAMFALAAAMLGIVRIGLLLYPYAHDEIRLRNALFRAIKTQGIHNAVVTVESGVLYAEPLDVTQNLSSQLDGDVVIATPYSEEEATCLRERYANRTFYYADGPGTEVTLTPY